MNHLRFSAMGTADKEHTLTEHVYCLVFSYHCGVMVMCDRLWLNQQIDA